MDMDKAEELLRKRSFYASPYNRTKLELTIVKPLGLVASSLGAKRKSLIEYILCNALAQLWPEFLEEDDIVARMAECPGFPEVKMTLLKPAPPEVPEDPWTPTVPSDLLEEPE